MSNTVRVAVRTRPTAAFAQDQINVDTANGTVDIYNKTNFDVVNNKQDTWRFKFPHLLHNVSQDQMYDSVCQDIVASTCSGRSGCLMTYGQTGSGKTYTMLGDPKSYRNRGIVPRALAQVFTHVASKPETEYTVSLSYMELYGPGEKIKDLLVVSDIASKHGVPAGQAAALGITVGKDGRSAGGLGVAPPPGEFNIVEDPVHGTVVRGLTLVPVGSEDDALNVLYEGELWRTTAQHHLNNNSNRSHCIFTIHLTARSRLGNGRERILSSKLHLVDLAGSERLKKTMGQTAVGDGNAAILQQESMAINKSLAILESCVVALTGSSRGFVPYRSSRLTNILKDALGGHCNTCLVACVWGEARHLEETISTLRLAQRMAAVQQAESGAEAVTLDPEELLKKLQRQVSQLKLELQMHDALAHRTDVQYGEYTPEQQATLATKVHDFLAAQTDDAEAAALTLESVAQMREILRQMKIQVRAAGVEAEERMRAKYMLVAKDGSGAVVGGMSEGASTHLHAGAGVTGGAGAIDESVSGLGLGLAPTGARPQGELLLPPSLYARSMSASTRGSSTGRTGGVAGSPMRGFGTGGSPTRGGAGIPLDINNAWKQFKSTPGLGAEQAAIVSGLRKSIADRKHDMATHARDVNMAKQRIDDLTKQLVNVREVRARVPTPGPPTPVLAPVAAAPPGKGGKGAPPAPEPAPAPAPTPAPTFSSDDEFRVAHEIGEAKKAYKMFLDRYNNARIAAERMGSEVNAALAILLTDFETWFAQSTGRLPPMALSPIKTLGASSPVLGTARRQGFGAAASYDWTAGSSVSGTGARGLISDDLLDEAEAFEKMEMDRAAEANPGSETYFSATRRIREGAKRHGRV